MDMNRLINSFSEKLSCGVGMIFVGSGISAPSGLPTWNSLLDRFADSINLKLDMSDNLPQIAQFIINSNGNNRGPLTQAIKERLIGKFPLNSYHEYLQKTNVKTIWTTNYDTLIEDSFRGFIQDVKAHDDAISRSVPNHQIEIIKMHGCIASSPVHDLVITLEDYEDFFIRRPATAERLRTDLLKNSFLFIGYGYGDPNINNIVIEARRLANQATRQHYMILKSEIESDKKIRQQLWIEDLQRVGIACALISDYSELDSSLHSIALKSRGNTLFVTGGHEKHSNNYKSYGEALADIKKLIILDGQSEGVSREIISAYTEICLKNRQDIRARIELFPNPYAIKKEFDNDPSLIPELKKWRAPLLRKAQIAVIFDGNLGTKAELEIAREMGCFIIPVPQKENDLPSTLLAESDIRDQLTKKVPDYLTKAESRSVTPSLLKDSI